MEKTDPKFIKGGNNMNKDKTIKCIDCGNGFVFTASEQIFYKEQGFNNEPKICKQCCDKKKETSIIEIIN